MRPSSYIHTLSPVDWHPIDGKHTALEAEIKLFIPDMLGKDSQPPADLEYLEQEYHSDKWITDTLMAQLQMKSAMMQWYCTRSTNLSHYTCQQEMSAPTSELKLTQSLPLPASWHFRDGTLLRRLLTESLYTLQALTARKAGALKYKKCSALFSIYALCTWSLCNEFLCIVVLMAMSERTNSLWLAALLINQWWKMSYQETKTPLKHQAGSVWWCYNRCYNPEADSIRLLGRGSATTI